jgi:hypothetical protein
MVEKYIGVREVWMPEPKVPVFFYGSYMNRAVLKEAELSPERFLVGRLFGYDIRIAPRANLVPSDRDVVYGALTEATHAELERLYARARDVLGETYLPHPVVVEADDGAWRPALCYLAATMEPRPADPAYVARIVAPARELGFPQWYVERLTGFTGA